MESNYAVTVYEHQQDASEPVDVAISTNFGLKLALQLFPTTATEIHMVTPCCGANYLAAQPNYNEKIARKDVWYYAMTLDDDQWECARCYRPVAPSAKSLTFPQLKTFSNYIEFMEPLCTPHLNPLEACLSATELVAMVMQIVSISEIVQSKADTEFPLDDSLVATVNRRVFISLLEEELADHHVVVDTTPAPAF